jgi:hypothetical protein
MLRRKTFEMICRQAASGASVLLILLTACSRREREEKDPGSRPANTQVVSQSTRQDTTVGTQSATPTPASRFVQNFYDWYAPLAKTNNGAPAWNRVLKRQPSILRPELARALRADSEAQARAVGEIAGLDFDPFLNSQDPCDHYATGRTVQTDSIYRVEVHSVCAGVKDPKATVVAELVRKDSSWTFVNMFYPDNNSNLLALLKKL